VEHFGGYARICFQNFGDRVKTWITLNEPYCYSGKVPLRCSNYINRNIQKPLELYYSIVLGYTVGIFPPGIKEPMTSAYVCAHNQLKAHATAYHIYDKEFRHSQNGRLGISLDCDGFNAFEPESSEDREAVERSYQFQVSTLFTILIFHCYNSICMYSVVFFSFTVGMVCPPNLPR